MLSYVLLRMRGTQLLVPEMLLARTDLIDACSLQTLALLHLDKCFTMPALMQGSAAGEACSATEHAAKTRSAEGLHELAQGS